MRSLAIVSVSIAIAGCDQIAPKEFGYKLVAEGGVTQETPSRFEYSKTQSFSRSQKFKLIAQTPAARETHLVIMGYTKTVDGKAIEDTSGVVVVNDGVLSLECSHYYADVPLDADLRKIGDPQCVFEPRAVFLPEVGKISLAQ